VVEGLLRECEASPERAPLLLVVRELERLAVEGDRSILRPPVLGLLGCGDEVPEGLDRLAGVAPVAGERGACLADLGRRSLEEERELLVTFLPVLSRQEVVCDVPDQDVREGELVLSLDRGHGLAPDQIASFE
jgi:hypothetical protein